MIITNPEFPPTPGMVEDVEENGKHYLKPTEEQLEKESKEKQMQDLQEENAALKVQQAQSDDAALALFESQAATDDAILAIYEKIGGTKA